MPGRLDRVGARVTTVARVFGRRIEGSQETTKVDKPRAYTLKLVGAGGAKATVDGTYAESGGGTDATVDLEYDLPMGLFAGVAEKLLGDRRARLPALDGELQGTLRGDGPGPRLTRD